jgi:uridine kinase
MALQVLNRSEVIAALSEEILHNYGKGRAIVAVDGLDGAGKSIFADELAAQLGIGHRAVFRASLDDFHNPRAVRYARGRDSAEGFYRDSYNYETFERVLVEPFRTGWIGSFVLKAFDLKSDAPFEQKWSSGPADALLIVDGVFANRPELKGLWNYSIWLDVDRDVASARVIVRNAADFEHGTADPQRYVEGQALYLKEANPRTTATAIIDNNDFEHPKRIFADSC